MYWEKVEYSLFSYSGWYRNIYDFLNDGDIFVEIGTWTGASSLFFAELIKAGSKKIDFYTIDTFEGSSEHQNLDIIIDKKLYEYYLSVREPLKDYIKIIKADSQIKETSNLFEDNSIATIFIDGDHSFEGIKKDLNNWYSKIKVGGIISGHDYIWGGGGVKPVVDSFSKFRANHIIEPDVWHYLKI